MNLSYKNYIKEHYGVDEKTEGVEYTAYTPSDKISMFLKKTDEIISVEKGKFFINGKNWKYKTIFKSPNKINRILSDYNLGSTGTKNVLVAD